MRTNLSFLAGMLLLGPAAAFAGEQSGEPKLAFHALMPATAKALDERAVEHFPPPVMTGLGARLEASGAVRYECRTADNAAYAAYRARVDAAIRGEEVR
jgi:hypothetical protein